MRVSCLQLMMLHRTTTQPYFKSKVRRRHWLAVVRDDVPTATAAAAPATTATTVTVASTAGVGGASVTNCPALAPTCTSSSPPSATHCHDGLEIIELQTRPSHFVDLAHCTRALDIAFTIIREDSVVK